jgi:hypothetical protein
MKVSNPSRSSRAAPWARSLRHRRDRAGGGLRRRQAGFDMVQISLVLIISALLAASQLQQQILADKVSAADAEADTAMTLRIALQNYTDDYYTDLQTATTSITRNGTTVPPSGATGAPALGTTLQPTIAQLQGLGYLDPTFSNSSQFLNNASYSLILNRTPSGCVAASCAVNGVMWLNKPYTQEGSTDPDSIIIGEMMSHAGGLSGASILGSETNITGTGGGWSYPNPVSGNPAGVFAMQFGASASNVSNYVRINDTRDPNLQGNFTLAGNAAIGGTLGVTGATTLSSLTVSGATQAQGTLNVAGNATFASSVNVNGALTTAGAITSGSTVSGQVLNAVNGSGVLRASMNSSTGQITALNSSGTPTVTIDGGAGSVVANTLQVLSTASEGTACASDGIMALDSSATGSLLVCRSGAYRRFGMGLGEVAEGATCGVDGAMAQTTAGIGLVCRTKVWMRVNDRLTMAVPMQLWNAAGPAIVPTPSCGTGGTPDIIVTPMQTGADYGGAPPRNRFEAQVTGTGPWSVNPVLKDTTGASSSTDFTGAAYLFGWTATTYCDYQR